MKHDFASQMEAHVAASAYSVHKYYTLKEVEMVRPPFTEH